MSEPGRMTILEAVAALDAIDGGDPEVAHDLADKVLQATVHGAVSDAYDRVASRCRWWAAA